MLNSAKAQQDKRECKVCHRTDKLNEDDICDVCKNIRDISGAILNSDFFVIVEQKPKCPYLILPFDRYIIAVSEEKMKSEIEADNYVRTYGKNKFFTGKNIATRLWVGDYVCGDSFEKLAENAKGIKRIAVLRVDIDNLGKTFVSGFENEKYKDKYVGLSRTTTFSRKMSIFFKNHINYLLEHGEYYLDLNSTPGKRNAVIVYAGGDDVFVIGSWDDIIGFAVDLHRAFEKFTQNTLTISAGIGIYPEKYPVIGLARETGELEECSKLFENKDGSLKNAITLFDEKFTFSWSEFIECVMGEKFKIVSEYFAHPLSRGKGFIYNLLDYLRDESGDKINLARLAYTLARLEPEQTKEKSENKEVSELYDKFKKMIYYSLKKKTDVNQVILALMIYVYLIREEEE